MVQVLAPAVLLALAQELRALVAVVADAPMPQCWRDSR